MPTRGLRGAVQATADTPEAIYTAARDLLTAIYARNPSLAADDIASIFFTMTSDLTSAYPALAARQLGWVDTPLLCAVEIDVPGGLERVIRVLLHWNTGRSQTEIHHVYLGAAAALRPDLNIDREGDP
ncbi:MAG TPA: chorismate mutase [Anaerolineales bacterium]|nr:chorismate mutase [Anaerolineales bacterium]